MSDVDSDSLIEEKKMSEDPLDQLFGDDESLDEAFGSDAEQKNEEPANEDDEEEAIEKSRIGRRIFGDDEESEGEETMKKGKPKLNKLGRKETILDQVDNLEEAGYKPYLVKLPGFIACDEEEYFADRLEEDLEAAGTDENGNISKDALLRLAVTMRWRQGLDGGLESNARLIEWSDGSLSLAIGPEQFEALPQKIEREQSYLFSRHTKEGCMEAVGKVRDRLAVRPFVTADQSHRKFLSLSRPTVSAATGLADTARVKLAVTTADPEREKQRMIKLEQERLKSKRKVEARRRNLQQRSYERVARTGLNARFLEEDEGEGDEEEDKYEDDFIDDTMKSGEEEEEDEDESSEDASYAGSSDALSSEGEAEGTGSSEESEAVSTEGSASESEEEALQSKKAKGPKKGSKAAPARKAAKIIDSDDDE